MPACTRRRLSASLIVASLVCISIGLFAKLYIPVALKQGILQQRMITSKDCEAYDQWKVLGGDGFPPVIDNTFFFNLSNSEEVVNSGAMPQYTQHGPVGFRKYQARLNPQWTGDDEKVHFIERNYYPHDAWPGSEDASTMITNVNPAYMGAMQGTGSELQMGLALTGPQIHLQMESLAADFIGAARVAWAARQLVKRKQELLSDSRLQGDEQLFYTIWLTAKSDPWGDGKWNGMLVSVVSPQLDVIDLAQAEHAWNSEVSASLIDDVAQGSLERLHAMRNVEDTDAWANKFNMSSRVAEALLLYWLPHFMCSVSDPLLCEQVGVAGKCECAPSLGQIFSESLPADRSLYPMFPTKAVQGAKQRPNHVHLKHFKPYVGRMFSSSPRKQLYQNRKQKRVLGSFRANDVMGNWNAGLDELVWWQYTQSRVSRMVFNADSVNDVLPGLQWATPTPELGAYLASEFPGVAPTLDATDMRNVFEGPHGLFDPNNLLVWIADALDHEKLAKEFNITTKEALYLDLFLVYTNTNIVIPKLLPFIWKEQGGLIATLSIRDWLFNHVDPLLVLLQPESADISFLHNQTEALVLSDNLWDCKYSGYGKNMIDLVDHYCGWHNVSVLRGIWNKPLDIEGTSGEDFSPWGKDGVVGGEKPLSIWTEDVQRVLHMYDTGHVEEVEEITLNRHVPLLTDFDENPDFNLYIQGFINVTTQFSSPIFLSKPHFLDTPGDWPERVGGLNQNRSVHETILDIEYYTGITMRAAKRLQTNVRIVPKKDPAWPFDMINKNMYADAMMPVWFLSEQGQITPDLASDFKSKVYGTFNLVDILTWVMLSLGVAFLCSGAVILAADWRHRKHDSYRWLHDDSSARNEHHDDSLIPLLAARAEAMLSHSALLHSKSPTGQSGHCRFKRLPSIDESWQDDLSNHTAAEELCPARPPSPRSGGLSPGGRSAFSPAHGSAVNGS